MVKATGPFWVHVIGEEIRGTESDGPAQGHVELRFPRGLWFLLMSS